MAYSKPQRLNKYVKFFPKSRTGCPKAEPVESVCTSETVLDRLLEGATGRSARSFFEEMTVANQAAAAFRSTTASSRKVACARHINLFNRPRMASDITKMTADVIAENRVKVLDVLASLESSPEDEAVLTDGLISAYHPKEVVDVVSLDTGNNKALCNQASDDVVTADNAETSEPSILRRVAQRFVKRISFTKRPMSACSCFRAA